MSLSGQQTVTRQPAVAGQFYPGSVRELNQDLKDFFSQVSPSDGKQPLAVIAPHAGYIFCGKVAAEGFSRISRDAEFDNIFVIGSSHRYSFDGASIYTAGNYKTPIGEVPVNLELAKELCRKNSIFTTDVQSQLPEHSLEVELPYLQYWLHKPFRIIPILLGTQNKSTCIKIAEALKPFFNSRNLFVISTDFSHYPRYQDAVKADRKTAEAVLKNNPDDFIKGLEANENKNYTGLVTSMCGWSSVLTMLYITSSVPGTSYKLLKYMNSGDADSIGDKSRVVGYWAMAVYGGEQANQDAKNEGYHLSPEERRQLLQLARKTIDGYLNTGKIPDVDASSFSPVLMQPAGAFVSLYKNGKLRGCIGRFDAYAPLYKVVQDMAVSSAMRDSRFEEVAAPEMKDITIEISVLTPLKKIDSADDIEMGKDGIYIRKGSYSGTFLPQVATTTGWTKEEFLGHCARDKAGIGWDGWKTAELFTYRAIVFGEK